MTLAPDGVERIVLAINGTVPGPTIEANWVSPFLRDIPRPPMSIDQTRVGGYLEDTRHQ